MKKNSIFLSLVLVVAACGQTTTPQERLTAHDGEINKIIAQMSLEEKVEMLHSQTRRPVCWLGDRLRHLFSYRFCSCRYMVKGTGL